MKTKNKLFFFFFISLFPLNFNEIRYWDGKTDPLVRPAIEKTPKRILARDI